MNRKATMLVLTLVLIMAVRSVHAQGNEPPIPAAPPEGTYILDTLDWLSGSQEGDVNNIVHNLKKDGVAEIFVITLDDCGADKRNYRKAIMQNWGIGYATNNNGLLILVCWYGGDTSRRSVEQEFGPGLNGVLTGEITDSVAKEQFVPLFKEDCPGDGLLAMVVYYDAMLRNPKETQSSSQSSEATNNTFDPVSIFVAGGVIVIFLITYFRGRRGGNSGGNYYGGDYSGGSDGGGGGGGGDSGSSTGF